MEKQQLLTDQDQNNDIFDKLGVKLDQILLLGENTTYVILIQTEILRIERIFQDLNGFEVLSAINEFVINKSKNILSNWYHVLMMNSSSVIILKMFSTDLKSIIGLLTFINQNDDLNEVKRIIDSKFIMNDIAKLEIEKQFLLFSNSMYDYKKNSSEEQQFLDKSMIAIEQIIKRHSIFHAFDEVNNINIFNEPSGEIFSLDNIDMVYPKRPFLVIEDGENVLYSLKLKLWIDTDNAVEANSFMNIITSTLGLIENVSIKIEGSGVGSYYQKIKMIFKGWFSSQEFEQIVDKTGKA
ncbi:MAG: hypothetical protein IPQ02_08360 [Saprospiraceae bacterium]|nr:hypothetical protein [Candidatus Defluviibacterium haderslevense]